MALRDLKPGAGEGRGVALGVLLSFVMHPVMLVAAGVFGAWMFPPDGALLVLPFLVLIGATQWLYLGPAAWLFWRRGSKAVAKGLLISGGLVTLGSTLCYGGMGLLSLQNAAQVERIRQAELENPRDYINVDGVVTAVDEAGFEFKREDNGEVVSLRTWQGLEYFFLQKDGGYEKRTRDMLKPGVRVSVGYTQYRGKPPDSASIVRVYEEGARR